MGDKNAVTTQQQLLDTAFERIRNKIISYIDDIFPIDDETPYEHYQMLCEILDILREQKLYVNRKKNPVICALRWEIQYIRDGNTEQRIQARG